MHDLVTFSLLHAIITLSEGKVKFAKLKLRSYLLNYCSHFTCLPVVTFSSFYSYNVMSSNCRIGILMSCYGKC